MKNYLMTFLIWIVLAVVFAFFFAGLIVNAGIYFIAILLALVGAVITCGFERQAERIRALEKRLEELGGKR
jgi:hypothetical protein